MEENQNPEEQQPIENSAENSMETPSVPNGEEQSEPAAAIPSEETSEEAPSSEESLSDMMYTPKSGPFVDFENDLNKVRDELSKLIIGQHELVDQLLICLFANGHVLLEGVPGIAKTLVARVLSSTLDTNFSRIQFTPDLMPSDVIGTSVYNQGKGDFEFKQGPIFSNLVLIDEINRAPAKTQSALFEVMQEKQVTFDGVTRKMGYPFFIIATQNPIEQEGTYQLPEAQLDRFLFRILLEYPSEQDEYAILQRYRDEIGEPDLTQIQAVLQPDKIKKYQELIAGVHVEDSLLKYVASIVNRTRNHGKLYLGASPRASLAILKSSKAWAAINGRDFITPDDIQYVLNPVLNHRLILTPDAEMEGLSSEEIIEEIVKLVEVPR